MAMHTSVIRAVERAGGTVYAGSRGQAHGFAAYLMPRETAGAVIEWWRSGDSAECLRVRPVHDHDDSMSDYSAGAFCHTIKSAIHWCRQWDAEYSVGTPARARIDGRAADRAAREARAMAEAAASVVR